MNDTHARLHGAAEKKEAGTVLQGPVIAPERLEAIQRMFDEIGLGRPEDRERFSALARIIDLVADVVEKDRERPLAVRLDGNATEAAESGDG